ncbi:MAG: hypothetical protein V2J24_20185, partial [Pseudomonadales bacterium]|nr:hypothetical protein [Pseudomonadales bacterium]
MDVETHDALLAEAGALAKRARRASVAGDRQTAEQCKAQISRINKALREDPSAPSATPAPDMAARVQRELRRIETRGRRRLSLVSAITAIAGGTVGVYWPDI